MTMRPIRFDNLRTWHLDLSGGSIALLLAAAAFFAVIRPTIQADRERQAQAVELKAEGQRRRDAEYALVASKDQLANAQAYIADLKLHLAPISRMNQDLSNLTELATRSGLQVDAVEPGREEAGPSFTTVGIRLSGRGSYRNFVAFLLRLRDAMPDHAATQIELSAQPAAGDTTATFSLGLTWYAAPKTPLAQN
jgi:Tfp pilus assembly protein PilO